MRRNFNSAELDNGLRVAWQRTPTETVFAALRVDYGALDEMPGEEGFAHFLEHILIEGGTNEHSPRKLAEVRDSFGYTNAFTSRNRTAIPWGMVPSDLETYLRVSSEMAFSPRLDEEVIEQQKEVVLREIARRRGAPDFDDVVGFFWPSVARDRDHTYFVLGEESVIQSADAAALHSFHARGYHPNNMVLMVAGKIPKNFCQTVERYFGAQPRAEVTPYQISAVVPLTEKTIRHSRAEDLRNRKDETNSNSHIMLGIVVPDEFHPDGSALSVAATLLGRSWSRGLKRSIRSENGLSYDVGSFYIGKDRFGYFGLRGKVHTARQELALELMFREMKTLQENKIDDESVERAKRKIACEEITSADGWDHALSADPINVATIARMERNYNDRIPLEESVCRLRTVTADDVQRVANQYLPKNRDAGKYVLLIRDPLKKD